MPAAARISPPGLGSVPSERSAICFSPHFICPQPNKCPRTIRCPTLHTTRSHGAMLRTAIAGPDAMLAHPGTRHCAVGASVRPALYRSSVPAWAFPGLTGCDAMVPWWREAESRIVSLLFLLSRPGDADPQPHKSSAAPRFAVLSLRSSGSLSRRAKQFGCMSRSHWTWPRRETDCDCEVQAVSGDQMIIGFSSRPAFRPQRTRCMHPRQKKDVH